MPIVDLAFELMGKWIPVDHGYALYAAMSRLVPAIHSAEGIGVHPIRGRYAANGCLALLPSSRLVLRLSADHIRLYLRMAGKTFEVDGHRLCVGMPEARLLRPATTLYSRLVTIKGFMEREPFLEAAKRKLNTMGITADLQLGERRTLRVKDKQVVGFEMLATGLDAESSVRLQEIGIGGRRRMGCGIFVPAARNRMA